MGLRSASRSILDAGLRPLGLETRPIKRVDVAPGVGPWFEEDTVRAKRITDFLADASFVSAYDRATAAAGEDFHIRWRTHVAIWAAHTSLAVPGDFVELGTGRGWMFSAILSSLDWNDAGRELYLCDRFVDTALDRRTGALIPDEVNQYARYYAESADSVAQNFREWSRVHIIQGDLPDSLDPLAVERIAFIHVDLNAADPEVQSLERLWPRLSPGGIVLFDDHAFTDHRDQYEAHRRFAADRGVMILVLPTGQGMIVRPSDPAVPAEG